MHIKNPEFVESLYIQLSAENGDGMHVEITKADTEGKQIDVNPIVSFREDEKFVKQIVLHGKEHDLVIPLSEFKRAIELAEQEVHCESFYDTNSE